MSMPPLPATLIQLLWFVRIVEAGSFSEAARRCGASTSAMSKAVSRLERSQGIRLLNRTTHSLSTTPEGDRLLATGRKLLADLEDAQEAFADIGHQGSVGRVRISSPPSFARRCLMPRLPAFLRENPNISIEVEFANSFLDMASRGIDVAIGSTDVTGLPGHFVRQLCTFPWIACATPGYISENSAPTSPSDLANHALIGSRNLITGQMDSWRFRNPVTKAAVRHQPHPRHVINDSEAAWEMICAGLGIGFAPAWLGIEEWKSGAILEVLREWRSDEAPLYAVRIDKRLTPSRVQLVQDFIVEVARVSHDEFNRVAGGTARQRQRGDNRGEDSAS